MRRIAVINQKGGVGKTTTAVNLGAALARLGQRVLICDLDPQCNLTVHVDVDPASEQPSVYDVLRSEATLEQAVRPTREKNLWVLPSSVDLAGVELELVNTVGREVILRDAFETLERAAGAPRWDLVLVDCPPSLGLLSLNALVLCDEVLVPVQSEFFALQGLSKLTEIVDLVQRRLNPRLRVTGLLSCRHDSSTNLGRQVMDDIRKHFGDVLLRSAIRRNVKLAEAPSHGKTIFEYDAESRGAADYLALARELLGEPAPTKAIEAKPVPVAPAAVLKVAPPKPVVAAPVMAPKVEAAKPVVAKAPLAKAPVAAPAKAAMPPKPVVAATSAEPAKPAPPRAKIEASKPVIGKPESAKPVIAKAEIAKPVIAKPAIAKPAVPAPIVAKPAVAKPMEAKPAAAKAATAPAPKPVAQPAPVPQPTPAPRAPAQPTVPLTPRALAEAKRVAAQAVPVPPKPAAPAKPAAAPAKAAPKAPAAIQPAATPAPVVAKPAEPARSATPSAPAKPAVAPPASNGTANGTSNGASNGATNGHAPAKAAAPAPRPAVAPAVSAPDPLAPAPRRPVRRANRPSTESTSQDP